MFSMETTDLKKFLKFIGRANKGLPRATGTFLNSLGFEMRDQIINVLSERMFVKQPGFIPKRVRVDKNKNFFSIRGQEVEVGSTALPRFGGWLAQQTGGGENRERFFPLSSRRGSRTRPAVRIARLLPGRDRPSPNDYKGPSKHVRAMVMIRKLKKQKYRKPFIVQGHDNMKAGLYKLTRNKPRMLQRFDTPGKTKRFKWMDIARDMAIAEPTIRRLWTAVMIQLLRYR
jgi:hypothetical protein